MWKVIIRLILRYRVACLAVIILFTAFMGYKASQIKVSQGMTQMLPDDAPANVEFKKFKEIFGEDGTMVFIGVQSDSLYSLDVFNQWYDLTYKIREIEGVDEVVSIGRLFRLTRNDSLKRFDFSSIVSRRPESQYEVDSLRNEILNYKIYDGLLFNAKENFTLMIISINKNILNTTARTAVVKKIDEFSEDFTLNTGIELHSSGLPYIRTEMTNILTEEIILFTFLSLFIAAVILFLFFRSAKAVFIPLLIAALSTVIGLGMLVVFGYQITSVTSIIPPLIIIICIENCVFLINRYYSEYQLHANKTKALVRVITRIGSANFLTNLTTAIGFGSFIITGSKLLYEFGIIASLSILVVYVMTLVLMPIFFSYTKPPKESNMKNMRKGVANKILNRISFIILKKRRYVYLTTCGLIVIALIGVMRLETSGSIVDDLSKNTKLYKDIEFIEQYVGGVMPFEFGINTDRKNGVLNYRTLQKINELQEELGEFKFFSKPLSVVEFLKTAKQAYYYNDSSMYSFPSKEELAFIMDYMPKLESDNGKSPISSMIDTDMSMTRLSVQMANVSSKDIYKVMDELQPKIDSIFPADKYSINMTGTCIVFAKGSDYMVVNLFQSLLLALVLITLLMSVLFASFRMILVCLLPNVLPLLFTAALMGYLGITIKPSTILVFSAALGISVDNSIHFLSRYRLYLGNKKRRKCSIKQAVLASFKETGYSMLFSSVVLFCGFIIFAFSSFGGIQAMGYLIAFTLFIALLCNLFLLPSFLLWLDEHDRKKLAKKKIKNGGSNNPANV